jgi:NodT family efflux transporter outer membrane factor (OMF) lipoprotein
MPGTVDKEGKRLLFLKKKKQKNFSPLAPVGWRHPCPAVDARNWTKVFLVLFFQKKNCLLPFPRRIHRARARIAGLALLGLAACTVGPDYAPPVPLAVANWVDTASGGRVTEATDPDPGWWNGFRDPVLTGLIERAIAGNLSLQQAVLRVVAAPQGEIIARAAGLPALNASASYTREQLGAKGLLESKGVYGQLNALADANSPLNQASPGAGGAVQSALGGVLGGLTQPADLFKYGLDASWELDLFGRVRRSVEQAQANTQAEAEATNDALVMLEGQVATTYFQLRGAQALLAGQQDNVRVAQQSLELTQRLQRQGLGTELDVGQAQTQLDGYAQQLPSYEKQVRQAINRLNILTGQPPGQLDPLLEAPAPLPGIPPVIGVGLPSTLARRRPDIRQAEAQLHAQTAHVGVAVASFYPDVSLTGNLGLRAVDASYLTSWASHFYAFGPSVSLPIFQGGQLTANLRTARVQEAVAALNYRAVVLNALREVEDALVAYRTDLVSRDRLADQVASGERTLYLARSSYAHGLTTFLQVLDAERTVVAARQQLRQTSATLIIDVVAIYNALGGGWQATPLPNPPAAGQL